MCGCVSVCVCQCVRVNVCVCFVRVWTILTKTSLMAALRAFSVSLISSGLAIAAVLISYETDIRDLNVIKPITFNYSLIRTKIEI